MHPAEVFLQALGKGDAAPSDLRRFAAKVDATGACWTWQAAHNGLGYGRFYYAGRPVYAHRFAFEQATGQHLGKKYLCHTCDTPACVNPAHLVAGDQRVNMADASRKGRVQHGSRHYRAALTETDVRAIRRRWAAGETAPHIAEDYGCGYGTVWLAATRRSWRHVE